jgi:hypothetical protein
MDILIAVGLGLFCFYVLMDIWIRRIPWAEKGCPRCGEFHDLFVSRSDPLTAILAAFNPSVSRVQCWHCLWSGRLRGLNDMAVTTRLEDGDDED